MKTRPTTTACLKLVVPDGDRDAVMVARAATGRNCERTSPRGNHPPFDVGAPSSGARRLVHSETEVMS